MIDKLDDDAISKSIKNDVEFEKILKEYKIVIHELKIRCVNRYGERAVDWFGI